MGEPIPTGALNVPSSVINTESTIYELKLKIKSTPIGGSVLGIIKPIWQKAMESEMRVNWLKTCWKEI